LYVLVLENNKISHVQHIPAALSSKRNREGSTNLVSRKFSNNAKIPNFHNPSGSKLSKASIENISTLSVSVPAVSNVSREKGVGFDLPVTGTKLPAFPTTIPEKRDSVSSPPQTFDDHGLVVTPVFSGADVIMTDATITSPHHIA
jgi:hypothetical protein